MEEIEQTKEMQEDYTPLFEDEKGFSEAELSGEEDEKPEKEGKESEEQPADQKAEKEPESSESEGMPYDALYEERVERERLRSDVQQLHQDLQDVKAEKAVEFDSDFKVLSDEELDELIEDDPQEALRYQFKLKAYNEKKAKAEETMENQQRQAENFVMTTVDRIEKAVPGLYDEDNSIAKDLSDFAIESGFKDEAFLEVMTNPATVVIPAGTDKRILLSNGAASLIEMLHSLHAKSGEKVQGKETSKARISSGEPIDTRNFTEAEWAGLSEEERNRLLGG